MLPCIKYWFTILFVRSPLQIEAEILCPLNQKESSPWPPESQPFRDNWQTCPELESTNCEDKNQAMNERIPACITRVRVKSSAGAECPTSTSPADFLPKAGIIPSHSAPHAHPLMHDSKYQSVQITASYYFPHLFKHRILHKALADIGNMVLFGQPFSSSLPTAPS